MRAKGKSFVVGRGKKRSASPSVFNHLNDAGNLDAVMMPHSSRNWETIQDLGYDEQTRLQREKAASNHTQRQRRAGGG